MTRNKRLYNSLELPFNIYSSSAENAYLSSSFQGFDITNLHEDTYGGIKDAPMQGPFAYKYVGGNQHRHVALNPGSDNIANRPELFRIDFNSLGGIKVVGQDSGSTSYPRAPYTRDGLAKRPLNLANIQQRTGSTIIGNYTHDYEVVQTVGRTSNNRAFIEASGVGFIGDPSLPHSGALVTQFVSGARSTQRALPPMNVSGTNSFVFVNRFNAPGGTDVSSRGVLDTYAEEYAPNNAMPWRNRSVRSVLRSDLTRYTPKATDIPPQTPTLYHTTNRNPKRIFYKPTISTQSFDNGFVTHAIPQCSLQYAWIKASAITTKLELPGYENSSSVPYGPYTDITFVQSGAYDRGDFVGISGTMIDKSQIEIQTPLGSTNFLSRSSATFLNAYNGPYQYPSWQQVRNLYNPVVRQLVKESILSLADVPPLKVNSIGNQVRALRGGVTNFKEPVVSNNSFALNHGLRARPDPNIGNFVTSSLTYTYNNNLSSFTNPKIRNRLGMHISDAGSPYDNLSSLYLVDSTNNDESNSYAMFLSLEYSQVLYPATLNAFLNETRTRTEYAEVSGTGSNGYDRIFGHQRTFFKEVPASGDLTGLIRTAGVAPNSQGYAGIAGAEGPNTRRSFPFTSQFDSYIFDKDAQSGIQSALYAGCGSGGTDPGAYCFSFGNVTDISVPIRYLRWKSAQAVNTSTGSGDGTIVVEFTVMRGDHSEYPALAYPDGAEDNLYVQYKHLPSGSWTNMEYGGTITAADCSNVGLCTPVTASISASTMFTETDLFEIRIAMTNFQGHQFDHYAIGDLYLSSRFATQWVDCLNFDPMATDGIRSFPESGSYRSVLGELMGDTEKSMFGASGEAQPSMAFNELYYLSNASGNLEVYSDYTERLTQQIANKNSWYNTYEKYASDLRTMDKSISILPEFKISDFIDYYLIERGGNFRVKNHKFLSLPGASITSSADTEDSPISADFVSRYVDSSKADKFSKISREHKEVAAISRVELSCKGIKKLLPYNGFYPADRTLQLGNLLSQSVSPHIAGKGENSTSTFFDQGLQGLLKPLVSPGILYNSIKSGIAVDYPIYTGSVPGLVAGTDAPSDFRLSSGSNYRLPFDSLLNLKGALPEGEDKPVRLVSSFSTFDDSISTEDLFQYSFTWDGEKSPLFELGMHNFLAETVDFFLEDGQLTSYKSQVQPTDGWVFESNKTYYMDVVLRDTVEMSRFVEYSGSKTVRENLKFGANDGAQYDAFGNETQVITGSPGSGLFSIVGARYNGEVGYKAGAAYVFQNALDTRGWRQLHKLTASDGASQTEAFFGNAVGLVSGTNEFHYLVGARRDDDVGEDAGAAYLYHSTSAGVTELKITASDGDESEEYGYSVSITSSSNGIYFVVGAPRQRDTTGTDYGGAYLYHSTSAGMTEYILEPSAEENNDAFGSDVSVVSSSNGVYVLVGSYGKNESVSDQGAAYLYHSTSAAVTEQKLTASSPTGVKYFGVSVSLASGSNDDGIYALIGANYGDGPATDCGEAYLFHSTSVGVTEQILTASDGQLGDRFGHSVSIASGSDGIFCLVGAIYEDTPASKAGALYLFHSTSAGIAVQLLENDDRRKNNELGWGTSLISSSDSLYAQAGTYNGDFNASGSGAAYVFAGSFGSLSQFIPHSGTQFDYKQHGKLFGMAISEEYVTRTGSNYQTLTCQANSQDPAYISYTPPYFYGESVARISFSPGILGPISFTLDEIFERVKVENILTPDSNRMATLFGIKNSITSLQNENRMPLSASANMFGRFYKPGVTYDPQSGEATSIDDNIDTKPAWVISTRFESPVLDVSSSKYNELYTAHNPAMTATYGWEGDGASHIRHNPRSMWTSYGDVPQGTKGVYFEIRESYPSELNQDSSTTASLLQTCGFTIPEQGKSKIGKVRENKVISEAIVALPYLDNDEASVPTTFIDGKYFIKINKAMFSYQKLNIQSSKPAVLSVNNDDLGDIQTTTISDMIMSMTKYVMPPHMDFVKYDDIDPFIAYFLEFEHTLDQKELTDIWQGVMPDSALKIEKDEVMISHDVGKFDFFGGIFDPTVFSKIKFFIFKVKRKAKHNYYEITKDSTDDSRFNFVFSGDPTQAAIPLQGSYNWPYDFFSLVEGAKIEAKFTLRNKTG